MRLLVASLWTLAACGSSAGSKTDMGQRHDLTQTAFCDDSSALAATYANVQRLFDRYCIGCHCCGGQQVELTSGVSYVNLINRPPPAEEACGGVLVNPGNPGASYLYQKLSSPNPCFGAQMPRAEFGSTPVPACAQELVRRWILEGAQP